MFLWQKIKIKTLCFYYKLELKYYFKELLLLESDSLPPEKGFIIPTGVITPTLRTTDLGGRVNQNTTDRHQICVYA